MGFQNIDIDAIECLKEVDQKYEEEPYYLLQQKLANNSVFQVEIWENEDGTYEGLAQEIPFSDRKSSIWKEYISNFYEVKASLQYSNGKLCLAGRYIP